MVRPSSGSSRMVSRVLVSGTLTLPVGLLSYQYVPAWSSKTGLPSSAGTRVATPSLWIVKPALGYQLNGESYACTRLRISVPSENSSGFACASTGRISPLPGWTPTLLSGCEVSHSHTSRPSWYG